MGNWLTERAEDNECGRLDVALRVMEHGCVSGVVPELIYYRDTTAFFKQHRREITALLVEDMQSQGVKSPADFFGDKWDVGDPFARGVQNRNLLAWYGFETVVFQFEQAFERELEREQEEEFKPEFVEEAEQEYCLFRNGIFTGVVRCFLPDEVKEWNKKLSFMTQGGLYEYRTK